MHYFTAWPQISLRLLEGGSNSLHEWILDRRIDLAVLHNPIPHPEPDIVTISYEQTVLVGPGRATHGSLLKIEPSIPIARLADAPLFMPALPHANRRLLENAATQHNLRLNIRSEVDSIGLIKAMIRFGLEITVTTFAIARRRETRGSWLINELAETVRKTLRQQIESGEWQGVHTMPPRFSYKTRR